MNKLRMTLNTLAILAFTLMVTSMAQAQATRTWVSGVGSDANPCSRTAPCKTFAGAIVKTAKDGEINAMDPGGYGAVTITKSITIDGNGTHASILAAGVSGVIINITDAADVRKTVRLRNISMNGAATGVHGVTATAFLKLFVEQVQIFGFQNSASSRGIRTILTAPNAQVNISDTQIGSTASGIEMSTSSGIVTFTLDRVRLQSMTDGLIVGNAANGIFRDSISSLNSGVGVKLAGSGPVVALENTMIAQNGTGVQPVASSTVDFSNTTILGNLTAITNAGTLQSHGNNRITLNSATPVLPTVIGQQ